MQARDMITIRNKKTGEVKTIPRENYETGLSGIGSDIGASLESSPEAFFDMIAAIPGGIKKAGHYALTNNPVETLGNLGAGGVEGAAQLLSSPQVLSRYLKGKFPGSQEEGGKPKEKNLYQMLMKDDKAEAPTIYEALMDFEKNHGLSAQSEDESSVRNIGNLIFGGKGLSKLPNTASRVGAITAQQGGAGGDPVHAAILGILGEKAAQIGSRGINKAAAMSETEPPVAPPGSPPLTANMAPVPSSASGYTTISNIPKAVYNVAKAIPEATTKAAKKAPEIAGSALASGLESLADYSAKTPFIGGAAQPTIGALASYLKHISVAPEELAKRNLMGDITKADIPEMLKRDEAGKRLGLTYLTPSELLDSPFEAVKQGDIGRTTSGMKLLYKKGKEREVSEQRAIDKLLDSIHTTKLDPIKNAAYEETMKAQVPDDFIARQTQRPVIQKAIKTLEGNEAYRQMLEEELGVKLGNIKPNSFMYWDMVKRVLGDFEVNKKKLGKPTTESSVYGSTRRSMVKEMDAIEPEYKTARNISERKFTKDKLKNVFDKRAKNFNNFNVFLKSEKNYENMLKKLSAFPEATQMLEDIKMFAGNMIPNNPKIREANALKRRGMSDARNAIDAKKRELDQKYGAEHDVAGVNMMTDPAFMEKLIEHLQ